MYWMQARKRESNVERDTHPTCPIRPGEPKPDDLRVTTPEERVEMMWPLVVETWAFMGSPVDESGPQRPAVRAVRGGG